MSGDLGDVTNIRLPRWCVLPLFGVCVVVAFWGLFSSAAQLNAKTMDGVSFGGVVLITTVLLMLSVRFLVARVELSSKGILSVGLVRSRLVSWSDVAKVSVESDWSGFVPQITTADGKRWVFPVVVRYGGRSAAEQQVTLVQQYVDKYAPQSPSLGS